MTNPNLGRQWWHGTPYGGASETPGASGVHVGTQEAARQALNARIGHRADGKDWDGTQEYGKTLLAGASTLERLGRYPTGYSSGFTRTGQGDHYPLPHAETPHDAKPSMFPVAIVGPMTNTTAQPHEDFKANGMMAGQLKRGTAKRGYYYRNVGEDSGSISAVVPSWQHLRRVDGQ